MRSLCLALLLLVGTAGARASDALFVEPDDGMGIVYSLIRGATKSLDMTMYELVDPAAEKLLASAAARGVKVRVILDTNLEKKNNTAAFSYLNAHGVETHWAWHKYRATHEKAMVVDGSAAAVLTLNLTSRYYPSTRDYGVLDSNPADIAAIEAVFNADFEERAVTPEPAPDLVWSPRQSDTALAAFIGSAQTSLWVENEEMSDWDIVNALKAAAQRGVDVRIVMNSGDEYAEEWGDLTAAGAQVFTGGPLYIHGKTMLADYGTPTAQAFVGSENFSYASLKDNRELGLIFTGPAMLDRLESTLETDLAGAALR